MKPKMEAKSKKNVVEKSMNFGKVFFIDFCDFRGYLGSIFRYFSTLFRKVEKASKPLFLLSFGQLGACKKHAKIRPKHDLENEGPPKSQKVVFVMISGFILEPKSRKKPY